MRAGSMGRLQLKPMGCDQWESELGRFKDANFQQSWAYADLLASRRSCNHEEVGFWDNRELVGLASVRIRKLPILGLGVAYVAAGPLVNRGMEGDGARFSRCLVSLREEYVQRQKLALRVLAPIGDPRWNKTALDAMAKLGMSPCKRGRGYRTFLLDLRRPLDEIRKGFAQKWRNCLNASEKQGLSIRWTSDPEDFVRFQRDHELFVKNKGFSVELGAEFYAKVHSKDSAGAGLALAVVERGGAPIAAHLGSYLGDTAVYLLGLTEEAALDTKAAYFLHWEVIKKAHEMGMAWYDLGGIDPGENPGVYKFKAGFSGHDVQAAGTMEIGPSIFRKVLLRGIDATVSWARR